MFHNAYFSAGRLALYCCRIPRASLLVDALAANEMLHCIVWFLSPGVVLLSVHTHYVSIDTNVLFPFTLMLSLVQVQLCLSLCLWLVLYS